MTHLHSKAFFSHPNMLITLSYDLHLLPLCSPFLVVNFIVSTGYQYDRYPNSSFKNYLQ